LTLVGEVGDFPNEVISISWRQENRCTERTCLVRVIALSDVLEACGSKSGSFRHYAANANATSGGGPATGACGLSRPGAADEDRSHEAVSRRQDDAERPSPTPACDFRRGRSTLRQKEETKAMGGASSLYPKSGQPDAAVQQAVEAGAKLTRSNGSPSKLYQDRACKRKKRRDQGNLGMVDVSIMTRAWMISQAVGIGYGGPCRRAGSLGAEPHGEKTNLAFLNMREFPIRRPGTKVVKGTSRSKRSWHQNVQGVGDPAEPSGIRTGRPRRR